MESLLRIVGASLADRRRYPPDMPIYEYACVKCGHQFEELVSGAVATLIACPACGAKKTERLLSTFQRTRGGSGPDLSGIPAPIPHGGGGGGCCGGGCGCGR